jgi:TolB-like protein
MNRETRASVRAPAYRGTAAVVRALALCVCASVASVRLLVAQCPDGTPPPCGRPAAARAPAARSLAVLTLENSSRDTSAQYLSEGLADQIATRLGGVARLTIISRSSVRRLREPDQLSIQQLGRTLNAAYLVTGAIRAAGGRVRVNVEAVRVATGEAVWSKAFDRAADDLIGIEETIATEVASGVAGRLSPEERRALGSRLTTDSHAYEQYLRGNLLLARRSAAALRGAIDAYEQATAADGDFADAYGRLAYAYALCDFWSCRGTGDSLRLLARRASTRALALDPRSSDAWMGRAYELYIFYSSALRAGDDSLLASLAAFRHAVDLNPRNDEAWHQYGSTLGLVSDSASIDALHRALAIDPNRAITYQDLSVPYFTMGRTDRALAALDSAVALDPDGPFRGLRSVVRLIAGDTAGAIADARLAPEALYGPVILALLAHDTAAARTVEATVGQRTCGSSTWIVTGYWLEQTGRLDQAVQEMLRCGPSLQARYILRFPYFAPLAADPRLRELRAETERILARANWR